MADWRSMLARGNQDCQQDLSRKRKAFAFYASNAETVPYSKRTRLLMLPTLFEKKLRERKLNIIKEQYKDKLLSYDHPLSVRVRSIKNRLIEALERDLRGDKVWPLWGGLILNGNRESYLDHVQEWETVVIDDPDKINARYLGGTIVVYTGLINYLVSDAELAVPIAHEIGHGVGRHGAEILIRIASLGRGHGSLLSTDSSSARKEIKKHPSYLSLHKELELEADYIGLILMASAGYDPSIGLKVLETVAKMGFEASLAHPSHERRVELAAQTQEEAMAFYENSKVHYIKHH